MIEHSNKEESRLFLSPQSKIGILNRGESAVRCIRAIKEYNASFHTQFSNVVFFLDSERENLFVKEADKAYPFSSLPYFKDCKGSPYLEQEAIILALKKAGCDAVWPGWGFLSENASFVKRLEEERIVFLGPSYHSMSLLGSKIGAKAIAKKAQVPLLPWSEGPIKSYEEAKTMAEKIGYPVIVKASNAGGGRGIRIVKKPEDLETQYLSARDETLRITGDEILFIERLVEKARHLEVQVLADKHGNVFTFGARDCSVQRRNQKIIEETPPPTIDAAIIKNMEESAQRLMKEARYESAGTVEFIYDLPRNEFYFMEVNTRLQVEHPITEQIYGIDLVKMQIHVAMGGKVDGKSYFPRGSAIEVRLNAEDPDKEFIPAPGRISLYRIPSGPGIRVDSGVEEGSTIPKEFDSMIAKIIAHGENRLETLARLKRSLEEIKVKVESGTTNRSFLLELIRSEEIQRGAVHTRFVEEMLAERPHSINRKDWDIALVACAIELYRREYTSELLNFKQQMSNTEIPREIQPSYGREVSLSLQGYTYIFWVKSLLENLFCLGFEGNFITVEYIRKGEEVSLVHRDNIYRIQTVERGNLLQCEVNGVPHTLELNSGGIVSAPSPAMVVSLAISPGQSVKQGALLLTLEAMKMEILVLAPQDGFVKNILVRQGEQVAAGQPMVQLQSKDQTRKTSKQTKISFDRLIEKEDTSEYYRLLHELKALFLGYDSKSSFDLLQHLLKLARQKPEFSLSLAATMIELLKVYVDLEKLFCPEKLAAEGFAQPVDYQEMLAHFFKRKIERKKGLPEIFIKDLEKAISWYPLESQEEENIYSRALFRIYKSHNIIAEKQEMVRSILFAMEESFSDLGQTYPELGDILDKIVEISQIQNPTLADTAIHARYYLMDRVLLKQFQQDSQEKIHHLFDLLLENIGESKERNDIIQKIIDSGHSILYDLLKLGMSSDETRQKLALELAGRLFNRDREFVQGNFLELPLVKFYSLQSVEQEARYQTLVSIVEAENFTQAVQSLKEHLKSPEYSLNPPEVLLLVPFPNENMQKKQEEFFALLQNDPLRASWVCLGCFSSKGCYVYKTLGKDGKEDMLKQYFHPLAFRELRVHRFANFQLKLFYQSESVYLFLATSRQNPKDERWIALVEVPALYVKLAPDKSINRIVGLEHAYMEAIYAMRAQQAKREKRLFWNRIILHTRFHLQVGLKQIEKYACRIAPRTAGLGLEKLVVYAPRRKKIESKASEVELLFENICGSHFTMRWRYPSDILLQTLDNYVDKVVRARQRGTVYPYEIIKLVTNKGYSGNDILPKGDFEEFDVVHDSITGKDKTISVSKRSYGENSSNVVFGIITNYPQDCHYELKRVLILSDPTVDMCSLAEEECKRVIAAISLAEERGIPVEWVPISAGAKIEMNSGTENLDWTARVIKKIIEFTQKGGEINILVTGINVGAQSYWNAEATMLMHTKGILVMTNDASMLLTGKKALDFSGSVSAEDNIGIGGLERIMGPNGQAQVGEKSLTDAYLSLFRHYNFVYAQKGSFYPERHSTADPLDRDVCLMPYKDTLEQGFKKIGDIFSKECNPERKKPFDMRQVMAAVIDQDKGYFERWANMKDAETAIVWETRLGGHAIGMIGIESRPLTRVGSIPNDGPRYWNGGTLFPLSSKKVARAINAFSNRLPLVVMANLSGFDGSPESLRKCQLEYGAEIGRAVVNFRGPIVFVIVARYHGGAYVVFSRMLNPLLKAIALENTYASVIGGAPAAAVVFPKVVLRDTTSDPRIIEAQQKRKEAAISKKDFDVLFQKVYSEKQSALAQKFDKIHSVERAKKVGSIDDIIAPCQLRPYLIQSIEDGMLLFQDQVRCV
ncbi:MAG: ATP-grasp domain-containing protein [Candidatus Brocadiae bacterium]|nr:ATP-grasp domain-containing protein [Candidatus Brocadiia bacterium]